MHHGLWWSATMRRYCCKEKQEIVCPVILEIDETYLDMNGRLTVTPVNVKLGIFNTATRKREEASTTWFYLPNDESEATHHQAKTTTLHKLENLHNALREGFKDLKQLMDNEVAVPWTLHYGGKDHEIKLRFFLAFIISDTAMHDKLCCHYGVRNDNIKAICRHCMCETKDLVDPSKFQEHFKFFPENLDPTIQDREDAEYWQKISHHPVKNAVDELHHGDNVQKTHLGTPGEVLHMHQLGAMKRTIESLAYKIKEGTKLTIDDQTVATAQKMIKVSMENLNYLSHLMGSFLARQSERDKPRTKFKNSVFLTTKKCAHEYAGVNLCLLLAMLTDRGRQIFLEERTFQESFLENEVYAFEMVLMFEQWLKKSHFPESHVLDGPRLGSALGFYIKRLSQICVREGMGSRLIKNHLVLHLPHYILEWGPPCGWDSATLERSHRTQAKRPAQLTQKRQNTFLSQLSQRYYENRLLERARQMFRVDQLFSDEIHGQYANKHGNAFQNQCLGSTFEVGFDTHGNPAVKWNGTPGRQGHLQDVLNVVCEKIVNNIPEGNKMTVKGFTEYKIQDQNGHSIYRAHPSYRSNSSQQNAVWYDWAYFDMSRYRGHGGKKTKPGQILMFVQVPFLEDEVIHNGIRLQQSKPHAVVRLFHKPPATKFRESLSTNKSVLYSSLVTFGKLGDGYYVIPCDHIHGPALVVPNILCLEPEKKPMTTKEKKARDKLDKMIAPIGEGYFVVKPRIEWGDQFENLIESFDATPDPRDE